MMGLVVISNRERKLIAKAKERASKQPVPLDVIKAVHFTEDKAVQKLADRRPDFDRSQLPETINVMIPYGYRAAYSVEEQPIGFCAHLSIGVEGRKRKGMTPSPEAVQLIADAYGIPWPPISVWVEEYEPGEYAVNVLHPISEREAGHA